VLRIFFGEADRHNRRPLYEAIILKAREMHLASATVLRGQMGFGHSSPTAYRQDHARSGKSYALSDMDDAAFGKMHQTPVWETSASGRLIVGPPATASSGSMAFSAARRTSRTQHF
jgi:hypothetical protein